MRYIAMLILLVGFAGCSSSTSVEARYDGPVWHPLLPDQKPQEEPMPWVETSKQEPIKEDDAEDGPSGAGATQQDQSPNVGEGSVQEKEKPIKPYSIEPDGSIQIHD